MKCVFVEMRNISYLKVITANKFMNIDGTKIAILFFYESTYLLTPLICFKQNLTTIYTFFANIMQILFFEIKHL